MTTAAVIAAVASITSAIIVGGPTWYGLHRVSRRNNADHNRNGSMLGEVLDLVLESRAWQEHHGRRHDRDDARWAAFLSTNPELVEPEVPELPEHEPAVKVSTR